MRIAFIDVLKGIGIVLMVIYHWFFDLNYFGIERIPILSSLEWVLFQRVIGFLFLFCTGAVLSYHTNFKKRVRRFAELGLIALAISFATYLYAGDSFVKFGIIHLIAVSQLLTPFFLRFNVWVRLFTAFFLIVAGLKPVYTSIPYLFWLGLITPDYKALDHYPLIPWFGAVLLGSVFSPYLKNINFSNALLEKIGRNSLIIYLVHQPLLVGIIMLAYG